MSSQPEPTILHEDESVLVVNKPAGLVVHTDGRTEEPTLDGWVLERYPVQKDIGGLHTLDSERYVPRAGILHRLDRETSGIIIIAKTDEIFYFFQRQFLDHSIEKTYNAFVYGIPSKNEDVIDLPIGRSRSDFRKWATGSEARGTMRSAITAYKTLRMTEEFSYLELRPKTGRTHQIRVHLSAIGHPIVSDKRYGGLPNLGFTRHALHASRLRVTLPGGVSTTFEAPLPEDFERALALFSS